jgi:pimeloyl-ACP methyl ester carboxylesterase
MGVEALLDTPIEAIDDHGVTPGGGLNSCIAKWPTAVFDAPEEFKNDFRCVTMDQRNATDGESTGPIPVDDPWGAFADDQLGLMDHLGIQKFFFVGYCIGGLSP